MTSQPTDQDLNAYIDGELSPGEGARVARAIARNPAIAARVACLTRVKSALCDLGEDLPEQVTVPVPLRPSRWIARAASIGLVAAIGILLLLTIGAFEWTDDAWYQEALAEHAAWVEDPVPGAAPEVDANLFLASLERFGLPVQAPDLTSAGLRLTYLRYVPPSAAKPAALHLGYTGRRGCKVTLWASPAPDGLGTALDESRIDSLRGFRWRSGATAYALFATGMAERRFSVIASKVYEATRGRHGFDRETRIALRDASAGVPPCLA
ncbi:MAG: hypothetical protein JSU82_07595 [Rhodospirillales bacterium]|nr:MAG: hypothetical protein JSU82_07595 [Rhodospirillales bacterium]